MLNTQDTKCIEDNFKTNGLSEESLETVDSKIYLLPKTNNFQVKPLGDITIKIEDIVPCMYL